MVADDGYTTRAISPSWPGRRTWTSKRTYFDLIAEVLPTVRPQGNDTLATIQNMEKLRAIERGASWIQLSLMDKVRGTRDAWTQRKCVVAQRPVSCGLHRTVRCSTLRRT